MEELPKGSIFAIGQREKVHRFVQFAVHCYLPWWVRCRSAASAPLNDLKLLKAINEFKKQDQLVADAALSAFKNHLWYLTEELVPLAFFSCHVSTSAKQEMADVLLTKEEKFCSRRFGTSFGKPLFPKVEADTPELSDFIGEDSWSLFNILKIGKQFLHEPVEGWGCNGEYKAALEIVENMLVVNDCAERGVKLAADFLPSAKKEDTLQNLLHVVENDRSKTPSHRTPKTAGTKWHIEVDVEATL